MADISDTDKPAAVPPQPTPATEQATSTPPAKQPPAKGPGPGNKPSGGAQRSGRPGYRDSGRKERRESQYTPVPSLEYEMRPGPKLRDLDAEIERELQEALGGGAESMLEEAARGEKQQPSQGEQTPGRKRGKVISIRGADVFIHVPGGRSEGVMTMEQFPEGAPAIGSEVEVHIEGYDRANGLLILTRPGAASAVEDWSAVQEGMTIEARVVDTNKGGLTVDVSGIRGFLPISQIDLFRVEQPEQFLNQKLLCVVTEVNRQERNLIVSRRSYLEKEREEQRVKIWAEIAEGQTREGIVRSVQPFGAFVDMGGVDGLVHVSEMSWVRVKDPTTVLQPGQRVKVQVLRVDHEKRKVSLGMKQLTESPWDNVVERYPPGSVHTGKVSRTTEFGAFVELEPAIEGLVHISELAPRRVYRVTDVVKVDETVKVQVLSVDPAARRMSLSLKAALPKEPEPAAPEEEEEYVPPPPRTSKVPLRGGVGSEKFMLELPSDPKTGP
jgi:small subunit ribosomal protein S1